MYKWLEYIAEELDCDVALTYKKSLDMIILTTQDSEHRISKHYSMLGLSTLRVGWEYLARTFVSEVKNKWFENILEDIE